MLITAILAVLIKIGARIALNTRSNDLTKIDQSDPIVGRGTALQRSDRSSR